MCSEAEPGIAKQKTVGQEKTQRLRTDRIAHLNVELNE